MIVEIIKINIAGLIYYLLKALDNDFARLILITKKII